MSIYRYSAREEFHGVVPTLLGSIPNSTSPPSIAHHIVVVNIAFILLSTTSLALRWYTSLFILQRAGFEDCKI